MSLPKDAAKLKNKDLWSSPVKEGSMKKMGAVNKAMKRRHFVLQGSNLFYFKKKGSMPLNCICIEDCIASPTSGEPTEFTIQSMHFDRVFVLRTDTPAERTDWVEAISTAIDTNCSAVSAPQDLQHNFHVSFDPDSGYKVHTTLFLIFSCFCVYFFCF